MRSSGEFSSARTRQPNHTWSSSRCSFWFAKRRSSAARLLDPHEYYWTLPPKFMGDALQSPLAAQVPLSSSDLANRFAQEGEGAFFTCAPGSAVAQLECLAKEHRLKLDWYELTSLGVLFGADLKLCVFRFPAARKRAFEKEFGPALQAAFTDQPITNLGDVGVVVVPKTKRIPGNPDLAVHSFQHFPGVFYRYRYRKSVLSSLPDGLATFLTDIPSTCPHERFTATDNARASAQERSHRVDFLSAENRDVRDIARASVEFTPYRSRHENVERYFLDFDAHCIATEVPVWMVGENPDFPSLTGHIDVLRWKKGRVEVWDYKPKARDEQMAALQVQLYCQMLSKRANLPLGLFLGGYFDEEDVYCFSPTSFVFG